MPSKSNSIISSHRDAATRVSKYLSETHGVTLKPIAALEIVARALGANNWQTLKAMADQGRAPRLGDGVWLSGKPEDLPPVGHGSVLHGMIARGRDTVKGGSIHRAPLDEFFLGDIEHDGSPGLVDSDALERVTRDGLQGPRSSEKVSSSPDLAVDQAQSMSSLTTRDRLWHLLRRATRQPTSTLADIDGLLDTVQHEMNVVLSPTQRAAVRHAVGSPLSVISGYPDSGKSILAEAIVRIADLAGMQNIINARSDDTGANFKVPEFRHKGAGDAFNSLEIEHLGSYLTGCDLLIIDHHVTSDKFRFWDVVRAAPRDCRIVILGEIPMDDGSEVSRMLQDLVVQDFAKFTQLHETLRQPHSGSAKATTGEHKRQGAERADSSPSARAPAAPEQVALITGTSSRLTNAGRYNSKFLPDTAPSQAWNVENFLYSPNARNFVSTELTGKWCVTCSVKTVDDLWAKVCDEIRTYRLFAALVSTPNNARAHGGSYIICVFTPDWADEEDVMRARQVLRELGVTEEIGYKRDLETLNGVYGTPAEWYYRA